MLSHFSVWLYAAKWTVACQAPLSFVQARIVEAVAMPSSRESAWLRDQIHISCIPALTGRFFTTSNIWYLHRFTKQGASYISHIKTIRALFKVSISPSVSYCISHKISHLTSLVKSMLLLFSQKTNPGLSRLCVGRISATWHNHFKYWPLNDCLLPPSNHLWARRHFSGLMGKLTHLSETGNFS